MSEMTQSKFIKKNIVNVNIPALICSWKGRCNMRDRHAGFSMRGG